MLSNKELALILGGIAVGSIATKLICSYVNNIKSSSQQPKSAIKNEDFSSPHYQEIKNQQLARIIKYFGQQKFAQLQKSYVIVFGVGGVGSHVVNMLARSGVGRIKIVDFDRVSLSSLNRHSFALRSDVGKSKVHCIKEYINNIFPHIQVDIQQRYVTVQNCHQFLQQKVDYVIDCIDNLDAKVQLITQCKQKNIKLIVSGGAGMKADPTRLQIRDIADVKYDSLIMRLKRQLNKKSIKTGIKVAFSYEQAQKQLLPLNEEQQKNPEGFKVFDNYRIRIVPVLGTMPAILGMTIASYVLCDLAGQPYKPFQTDYVKSAALNKLYNELINDQRKNGVPVKNLQVDMEEVCILAKEVYDWKCLVTDKKESSLRLTRWDRQKQATLDNLVLLGKQQYEKHITLANLDLVNKQYASEIIAKFAQKSAYAMKLWKSGFKVFV